jgi:hypothetical protein
MTIHGRSPSMKASWTTMMPGCRSCPAACASRTARAQASARLASSRSAASVTSFIATSRPSVRSSARQTVPIPPLPRMSSSS